MKKNKSTNKIMLFYIVIPLIMVLLLYLLLPHILNYPPNSIDNSFQKEIDGLTYSTQFILIILLCIAVSFIVLIENVFKINIYLNKLKKKKNEKLLEKITQLCLKTPLKLYISQITVPMIAIPAILMITGAEFIVILKISSVFILFLTLVAVICYVFSQAEFKKIIIDIYSKYKYENKIQKLTYRFSIKYKLILELLPLIIVALIFIPLLSSTMNSKIIGDVKYNNYNRILNDFFEEKTYSNKEEIISLMKNIETEDETIFIIDENGKYQTLNNNELSEFFIKYTLQNKNDNRTYDYYCISNEGTFVKLNTTSGESFIVGLMYETSSPFFTYMLIIAVICLLLLILIILWYITTSLTKDIELVKSGLNKILADNDLDHKLIVTSKDEIGELIESFNGIQELTKNHIEDINQKQGIIREQTKFVAIGQVASLMAHNINNPASAIDGSINLLYDFKVEEDVELYKKIIDNMKLCNDKIRKIVNDTMQQFRNTYDRKKSTFNLNTMLQKLVMEEKNEIQKVNGNINVHLEKDITIFGVENKLYQIIVNMVRNSVLTYIERKKEGNIDIYVTDEKDNITIAVEDTAGGIPKEVEDRIFKEIVTTRGVYGTGLGLFLAKPIIEVDFKGELTFKSDFGKGTTFYIKISKNKEEK